ACTAHDPSTSLHVTRWSPHGVRCSPPKDHSLLGYGRPRMYGCACRTAESAFTHIRPASFSR
ncbi:MAG: hypothetical protein ACK53Y_16565, partial [bacterium]